MKKTYLLSAACVASLSLTFGAYASANETTVAVVQQDTSQVLEALGMGEGAGVSYDTFNVNGGVYSFTNYRAEMEEAFVSATRVVYEGVRFGAGGDLVFDSVEFLGGVVSDQSSAQLVSMDRITISNPSEALVAALSGSTDENDPFAFMKQAAGEMVIEGMSSNFADGLGEDMPSGGFSIARIVLDNADGDEFADMSMTDMQLNVDGVDGNPGVSASLESASGSQILIESLFNGMDPESFDASLAFAKTYEQMQVSNFLVQSGGVRLAMPVFNTAMEELSAGAIRTTVAMPSFSMAVDPTADEQSAELAGGLAMLGYDSIDLSYTGSYVYDPAADRLFTDAPSALTLRDGGTFDVQYDMTGMTGYLDAAMEFQAETLAAGDKATAQMDDEAALELLSAMSINGMSMSFDDAGLLDRGLALFAMQSGVDVETARMQAGGMVALMAMGAGESLPPSVVAQMSQALMGFIQNGGRIEVGVQPAEPLKFEDVAAQGENFDIESLGLTFSHEAP